MPKKKILKDIDSFQLKNIRDIIALEQRDRIVMTTSDRLASKITEFSGSMLYVGLHVIWFALWIAWNTGILHLPPFDRFPFNLLTMMVSLEAIFLASFVLISQNKQALQADKRAKIDLQVNMISERENTKLIEMVEEIHKHLGIYNEADAEVRALKRTTNVSKLADAIDKVEAEVAGKNNIGPKSAADTSK
jgi:uncharacterized membrane protein